MFKALTLFRLTGTFVAPFDLSPHAFQPCQPTQAASIGFVPPRGGASDPLFESVQGNAILALTLEQRILPASVVKKRVEELAKKVEEESGRKPGAKRRKELKEEATLELLPKAFTRQKTFKVWIAHSLQLLAIDSTSSSAVDLVLSALARAFEGLALAPWNTQTAPAACMAAWLLDGQAPHGFAIGRDCTMESADMTGASASFSHHALDVEAVTMHLVAGKQVCELALSYKDQAEFVLNGALQLKRIELTIPEDSDPSADAFDADVVLAAGVLGPLITDLTYALGGLMELVGVAEDA